MRWSTALLRFLVTQFDRIAVVLAILVALAVTIFGRSYLYLTFTDAQAIAALRAKVAAEDIDQDRFLRVRMHLRARAALAPLEESAVRDAFSARGFNVPASESPHRP